MDSRMTGKSVLLFILSIIVVNATHTGLNETVPEERQPRVSGRIVKLYSGTRPEPVYCAHEGFQADLTNCAVFYRCVKGANNRYTVFKFQCGPGTVYDPDTEVCNFPQRTRRSECGGSAQSSSEKGNENEIEGMQPELPSPIVSKPAYSDSSKETTYSTVSPWATSKHQNAQSSSASTAYPWGTAVNTASPTRKTTALHPNREEGDICTKDGFMGDSENCRKFYRCVGNQRGGFIRYEFSCSESTVWDEDAQSCNHPWAVQRSRCGRSNTNSESNLSNTNEPPNTQDFPNSLQQQLQINYGSKVSQTQTQINHGESIQNQTQINYGNRNKNGQKLQTKQNQTQLSYGSAISQTQTQINHGNNGIQIQLQVDHTKESSQAQAQVYETSSKITMTVSDVEDESDQGYGTQISNQTSPQQSEDKGEENECTESGFMGDKNDCKKFYRCVDNGKGGYTKYEFSCGEGTVWDSSIEACNHAWAVKECRETAPQNSSQGAPQTTTTIKPGENHQTTSETDDNEDTGYGNQNQQPEVASTTTTTTTTTTRHPQDVSSNEGSKCKSSGFIGDNNDCKKFYRCVDNGNGGFIRYEFSCGEGTVWDSEIEACNHAWAVKECGGTAMQSSSQGAIQTTTTIKPGENHQNTSEIDDNEDTGYGNQNQQPEVASTTTTTTTTTTRHPQDVSSNEGSKCKSSGFIGDNNDCKKFYRCVDNGNGGFIRYEFSCGEGTVWDSEIEACNHAWAVKECGGTTMQSSSQGAIQTTTTIKPGENHQNTSEIDDNEDTGYGHQNQQPENTSTTTTTRQPQDVSSNEGNECKSSGFKGDKNDCKKFYRCVDNGNGGFIRYEFSCGEGTVWDPKIKACNHAWAVEKCGEDNSSDLHKETTSSSRPTLSDEQVTNINEPESNYPAQHPISPSESTDHSQTTLKPPSGKECNQEGFMGDDKDCMKFYRCVYNDRGGFTKYEFSCGEGTVWDSEITACNHPNSVKRHCNTLSSPQGENVSPNPQETTMATGTQTSSIQTTEEPKTTENPASKKPSSGKNCTQEGFMGDENDCKKFYRCVDNGESGFIKYEFSCGDGTVWDSEITACNHQSPDKTCGSTSSQAATISAEPDRENDETYTDNSNTPETSTQQSQTTSRPQNTNDKCTTEGFFGDSNNCKKFFRCVDNGKGSYTKYEFMCGDGTIWDQEIQACNHDTSNSNCPKNSEPQTNQTPTDTTEKNSSSTSSNIDEQPSTQIPHSPPSESHGNCTSEGFYGDPDDCHKFYRCVDNGKGGYTKYDFSCGEGTVWVQDIQACDHDSGDITCNGAQTESSFTTSEASKEPQSSTVKPINSVSTQETDKQDDENLNDTSDPSDNNNSKNDCTSEGFYPNKDDCRKFYRCVDNGKGSYTKYDFACGEGTAWDQDIQTCNHISEVKNCQEQETQSKPMQDEETSQSSTSDNNTESSTSGPTAESSKPANKDKCEKEGYFGNTQDCMKFYRCVDNGNGGLTKYDFTCGEGTIWDQEITTCNHPQDVSKPSCEENESNYSESPTSSTTSSSSSSSSSESTTSTTEKSSGSDCSSRKPDNKNVNCTEAGYYPDPNDCKKFYRCVDWDGDGKRFSVYHFECGEGTIWDPALDTCNHEDSVYPPRDCSGGSQTQGQNVNQESSTTESTTVDDSTTMQQSTTEETTTQESTTSKQTTQSSSDQTTTEQETEKTTAQQTEQTTAQQTEQSTAQQTEQTTTLQTEQTTAEQTDQTTAEQTEQTTAQQTEETTTQQSTTSDYTTQQTTTQQTEDQTNGQSTTEQTTTQSQETTSEHTTTQQSTTEDTTIEQTTTQESTTSEMTTEQSDNTEKTTSATESGQDSTTQQIETEGTTTQESTTNQTDDSETTESSISTTSQDNDSSTTESEQESTTESGVDQTTANSSSNKDCPETEDDQNLFVCPTSFKRHPKYCNMFYQCTEDDDTHDVQIATFHCPNNTIYDESKTQCVEEKKADKKCEGEIAQKRRVKRLDTVYKEPIVVTNERLKCPAPGHYPFEKGECSPAFLKCQKTKAGKIRGYVYQCPQGYVYWSVSRRCEPKSNVRDCAKSHNDWNGRWEIPIERRNVAP